MKRTFTLFSSITASVLFPGLAFAQAVSGTGTVQNLFSYAIEILNDYVVPLIFAVAFILFLFNVYRYFIAGGANEEKVGEGRRFVVWSMVGFVVMFSIWGLINIFIATLGFNSDARPALPTFGTPTNSSASSLPYFGGSSSNPTGSTIYNGATYANTVPAINGLCPSQYIYNGSTCVFSSTASSGAVSAPAGSVAQGGNCSSPSQCKTGTCDADGICNPIPGNGTVSVGGSCAGNEYACSSGECNTSTNLCQAIPGDGTVQAGGSCLGNERACAGNLTCNTDDGDICEQVAGNGTVGQGGSCLNNPNACQNGLTCADNTDTCQPDNGTNYDDTSSTCCDDGSDPSSGQCSDGTPPYSC